VKFNLIFLRRVVAVAAFVGIPAGGVSAQGTQSVSGHEVTQAEKTTAIEGLAKELGAQYVDPDMAKEMIRAIREHQARHEYDGITDGEKFAKALTNDLQAVSKDHHLGVDYSAEPIGEGRMDQPSAEDIRKFREAGERRNFQYRKVERLEGGIGLLQVDGFYPAEFVQETAAGAAGFLAHTEAVILDLRQNHGGNLDGPLLLASYFFKEMTHLTDFYNRAEKSTQQIWTMPVVPGPSLADKDLYILVSRDTFSAPEALAFDLQALGRAKIIGEPTGGGAHGTKPNRLTAHFVASIPFNVPINPRRQGDWEGVGVKPDVQVPAADALRTAHVMALKGVLERTKDEERRKELDRQVEELKSGKMKE
jgi:retinol-binding protein 3